MSSINAVDCQSFAGGFTLGMARAGFNVVAKRENLGGFGVPMVDGNRHLINPDLDIQVATPQEWEPRRVPVVFGNPPCSGFSGYTGVKNQTGSEQGSNHAINACMWDLVAYAAACKADVVVMESVQKAYSHGRDLMQALRADMEERTGKKYDLTHVLHNNASVGGASIRRRYFMVLSRSHLKFGVEPPQLGRLASLGELLKDLEQLRLTPDPQKYRRKAVHPYPASLRSETGMVDGHQVWDTMQNRVTSWIAERGEWHHQEKVGVVTQRLLDSGMTYDDFPDIAKDSEGRLKRIASGSHAFLPRRWGGDRLAGVITGGAGREVVHPYLPRMLTFREMARVLGYPDDWSMRPIFESTIGSAGRFWLGKGISVPCGEWIGAWVRAAIERQPGTWRGDKIGDREWVIDVTNDHKAVYDERTGEHRDSRSKDLRKAMAARVAS